MIEWTPDAMAIHLGPLALPWYGIGYAVAIAVGVWLVGVEARRRGLDASIVGDGLILVVVCGVIGARMYHVIDQWQIYKDDLLRIVLPPYSGLALYGGVGGGIVGVFLYTRRRGQSFLRWADAAVPSLFIGQAIARWGNFFNQELYGPPTNLPWGIAIDCAHRVAAYPCSTFPLETTGFHPLFFYESAAHADRRPRCALARPAPGRPASRRRPRLTLVHLVRRRAGPARDVPRGLELGRERHSRGDSHQPRGHRPRRGLDRLAAPGSAAGRDVQALNQRSSGPVRVLRVAMSVVLSRSAVL